MFKKPLLENSKNAIEKELAKAQKDLDAIADQELKKAELTEVVKTLKSSLKPIQQELDEIDTEAKMKLEEEEKAKKAEADKAAKAKAKEEKAKADAAKKAAEKESNKLQD